MDQFRGEDYREFAHNCFIATAAHGSAMHEDVVLLRKFRDEKLTRYRLGRAFIELYNFTSPPFATLIRDRPALRAIVRATLRPIVACIRRFR